MTVVRSRFSTLIALLLFAVLAVSPALGAARVVAVGDIHGDLDHFKAILRDAGLLDAGGRWSGGNATLVQTGDAVDRGPNSRGALELLMQLEKQASQAGGKVIALLGNHEVMNIIGDLRYVGDHEWATHADANSEKRRQAALQQYKRWLKQQGAPELTAEAEKAWLDKHPPGFVEQRQAFAPDGRYGKWLRQRAAVAQVGDSLFVHAGIHPTLASLTAQQINDRIHEELRAFDDARALLLQQGAILPFFNFEEIMKAARPAATGLQDEMEKAAAAAEPIGDLQRRAAILDRLLKAPDWLCIKQDGPLWFRGFAQWSDAEGADLISGILASEHVARVVVGHSAQEGRIRARWNDKVFLIDTGMLGTYVAGGRGSALEIDDSQVTAIYDDGRVVLHARTANATANDVAPPTRGGGEPQQAAAPAAAPAEAQHVWLGPDGNPLPFKTDAEVIQFLKTAKVIKDSGIPTGITGPRKLLLEKDGVRVNAVWRQVNEQRPMVQLATGTELLFRDSYIFEPAAYELSQMLGMDSVPPTAIRKYQGNEGSVQIWVEKSMTETDRLKQGAKAPDGQYWNKQLNEMNIFDQLIYNVDRNRGNILITPDWKVWWIDHTRTFRRQNALLDPAKVIQCERGMFEKLKALNLQTLQEHLKPYLGKEEINTLEKRRQLIVARLEQFIQEKGEDQVLFTLVPPQTPAPPPPPPPEEKKQ